MKKLIVLFFIVVAACNQTPTYVQQPAQPYHEIRVDPNTGQQVVYVQQADGTNYFLDYLLFNSLFNSGGYGSVYGYYNTHTTIVRNYSTHYNTYKPQSGGRYYGKTQDKGFRPSAPSAPSAVRPSAPSAVTTRPSAPSAPSAVRPSAPSAPSYHPSAPTPSYRPSAPSYHSSSSSHSGRR